MRSSKIIHVVTYDAEGEVGDVIVGGVAPPPGETLWEQSRFIAKYGALRNFILNEPRGGVFCHVNLRSRGSLTQSRGRDRLDFELVSMAIGLGASFVRELLHRQGAAGAAR
jgi:hypothetical protein